MEQLIISIVFSLISAAVLTGCGFKVINILQLSSYRAGGVVAWLKRTRFDFWVRLFALGFFSFAVCLVFCMCFPDSPARYAGTLLFCGLCVYFLVLQLRQKQKTPLKFTRRVVRLCAFLFVLLFLAVFSAVYFLFFTPIGYSLVAAVVLLLPIFVAAAHFACLPMERLIAAYYFLRAKKRLSRTQIIKIGITGSYGKTTAKSILSAILSEKFKVLPSPSSYNTPMGLSKIINGGLGGYEVFIAEMGARRVGDIAQLCDLVQPDYGIITTVGTQHLETFGSVEGVLKTKFELAQSSKICLINSDDKRLMSACATQNDRKKFLYCGVFGADASYNDVSVSAEGTSFNLTIYGSSVRIVTQLLGRHIPQLFCLCALLAFKLGIGLDEIAAAAQKIEPIEHRLQLIKTPFGAVIDDAYNSNPEGAASALEVLSMFEGDKVVVTPGFVELGAIQSQKNYELGGSISAKADFLICVKNSDIFRGAQEGGMDESKAFFVNSLTEATAKLKELSLNRHTVLFLNDLPDNY